MRFDDCNQLPSPLSFQATVADEKMWEVLSKPSVCLPVVGYCRNVDVQHSGLCGSGTYLDTKLPIVNVLMHNYYFHAIMKSVCVLIIPANRLPPKFYTLNNLFPMSFYIIIFTHFNNCSSITLIFWRYIFLLLKSSVKNVCLCTSCLSRQQQVSPSPSKEAGRRQKTPSSRDTEIQWSCTRIGNNHWRCCGGAFPNWREHCVSNMAVGGSWQWYVCF